MTTALVKSETITALDSLSKRSMALMLSSDSPFGKMFETSQIMTQLRTLLGQPGVLDSVMALQGSAIGFKTDKKPGDKYAASDVVDALIEATMRGVYPVGNEFNIISGRCYVTKEGFSRLLKELPGLTRLRFVAGIPEPTGKVKVTISCNWNGEEVKEDLEFMIRVNTGMGPDAITGKAERKAKAWLYRYLTGSEIGDGDVEDLANGAITVKASPFAAPTEAPVVDAKFEGHNAQQSQAVDYWACANAKCQELGITEAELEAFSQKSLGRPWMEIPDSTLKAICERPQDFLKKIQEMRTNAG